MKVFTKFCRYFLVNMYKNGESKNYLEPEKYFPKNIFRPKNGTSLMIKIMDNIKKVAQLNLIHK